MDNVVEIEKTVAGLKKITLRSYLGKTQGSLTIRPVKDKMTGRLKGVKRMTDDEMRRAIHVVTNDTERVIKDNTIIDLEDQIDAIDWEWMKFCPEIFSSLEECFSNHHIALFYVENLEKDTEERVKKRYVKKQAYFYLDEASQPKKIDVARILGTDATTFTKMDLEDYLYEIAEANPKRIIEAFEDKLIKVKLFLFGLLDKRIILVDQDGVYRWNNHILGTSEKSALDWLQMADNAMHVKRLSDELYPVPVIKKEEEPRLANHDVKPSLSEDELKETLNRERETDELEKLSEEQLREMYKSLYEKAPHPQTSIEKLIDRIRDKKALLEIEDLEL